MNEGNATCPPVSARTAGVQHIGGPESCSWAPDSLRAEWRLSLCVTLDELHTLSVPPSPHMTAPSYGGGMRMK